MSEPHVSDLWMSRSRGENGDDILEIELLGVGDDTRRIILFVEPNGIVGYAIASMPPAPRDGSGLLESPSQWLDVIERGLAP